MGCSIFLKMSGQVQAQCLMLAILRRKRNHLPTSAVLFQSNRIKMGYRLRIFDEGCGKIGLTKMT